MANMSYCRFRNTVGDMEDCVEALEEGEADRKDFGEEEMDALKEMIRLSRRIVEEFGHYDEEE